MTIDRRRLLTTGLLAGATLATPGIVRAAEPVKIPRKFLPQEVPVNADLPAGQIHVRTDSHFLYWTLGQGRAMRYGIAVGAQGRNLTGTVQVRRKAEWPSWMPTANMIRIEPEIYAKYRRGLPGGHEMNPLGARALYLYKDGRDTLYRIHGTPQPWTIGRSFSSGCVRLRNEDIEDLYARVPLGTVVTLAT